MNMSSSKHSDNEVLIIGNEILKMLQDDLMTTLETGLRKRWGSNWFEDCLIRDDIQNIEIKRDLQFILKQIVQKNNGNFRLALAEILFTEQRLSKLQLDSLANIQKFRNMWAHPESSNMTLSLLQDLSNQVVLFYGPMINSLVDYCKFVLRFKESDDDAIPKILANSVLFRRHLSEVNGIVEGITENSKLLSQISQLKDKLDKSNNYIHDNEAIIPGYESLKYSDLDQTLATLNHGASTLLKSYAYLHIALAAESLKIISISKSLSKDKQVSELIRDFESEESLKSISQIGPRFTEIAKMAGEMLADDCKCQICEVIGSGFVIIGEIKNLTEFTSQIYTLITKHDFS